MLVINNLHSKSSKKQGLKYFIQFSLKKRQNFFYLEDFNLVPWLVLDVFVNGEDEHEHEEESSAAKEVPNVVPGTNTAGKIST